MRFLAVLNRDSGTLQGTDIDAFSSAVKSTLEAHGHSVDVATSSRQDILRSFKRGAARPDIDVLLVAGGDGTISAALASIVENGKILAILPAGTMNLFARSLRLPLSVQAALEACATGKVCQVDVASANGRFFVHQFSVGMHARIVELRSRMAYSSRLGKIAASFRAAIDTIRHPTAVHATLTTSELQDFHVSTAGIAISNNLYGEGHLPFAERPDGHRLGIYVSTVRWRIQLLLLCVRIALGRWRDNPQIDVYEADKVTFRLSQSRRNVKLCVIDGELLPLEPETVIATHPGLLRVLVPADSGLS